MSITSTESATAGDREVATQATAWESGGNGKVAHLSLRERAARGKAKRADVPRSVHGEWSAPSGRHDPVELLEEQAASRVPELVPIRYGRMLAYRRHKCVAGQRLNAWFLEPDAPPAAGLLRAGALPQVGAAVFLRSPNLERPAAAVRTYRSIVRGGPKGES